MVGLTYLTATLFLVYLYPILFVRKQMPFSIYLGVIKSWVEADLCNIIMLNLSK